MSSTPASIQADFQEGVKAHFSQNASTYEEMSGGSTRRLAESFFPHLPPLTPQTRILDNACGPGVVTKLIIDTAASQDVSPPPSFVAADYEQSMIDIVIANKAADPEGWKTVDAKTLDAQDLQGLADGEFDATIMNSALFALPDPGKGAREMLRVLKPGGVAIVTTWKKSRPVDVMQEVVDKIRPGSGQKVSQLDECWNTKERLVEAMVEGGFEESKVSVYEKAVTWAKGTLDELVEALSGPFWQKIWKDWPTEEQARWRPEIVNTLTKAEKETASIEMIAWVCVAKK